MEPLTPTRTTNHTAHEQWRRQIAEGATFRQVAATVGRDESTTRRHVGKTGRRSGPVQLGLDPELVRDLVAELGSALAAAQELGVPASVVRHRLWAIGEGPDPSGRGRPSPGLESYRRQRTQ